MDTIYTIAYILVIIGIVATLVVLLMEVLKVMKKILAKKEDLEHIQEGLDHIKKDVDYIKEVKDKTFLDEILLILSFANDFKAFEKKEPSRTNALVKAARKDLPKESLTQLKNKIKAL